MPKVRPLLSLVVPLYNERSGLQEFHEALLDVVEEATKNSYEVLYCDDGSTDNPAELVQKWHDDNPRIRLIRLSRNFGKEYALSAGLAQATGQAIMMIDGDGQHPVELIPEFVSAWERGFQVVVGIRTDNSGEGLTKRLGSSIFNQTFKTLTGQNLLSGSTDFRLIDRSVQKAFLLLKENDRLTRGLIDWLGFERTHIHFVAKPRMHGSAGYSTRKLIKLAIDSLVSLTPRPLYLFGYLGIFIMSAAFLLGVTVIIEQLLFGDPLSWRFTGTAMLGILILFLVGIVLMSQAMLSLYIAHIQSQTRQRPLYVIDYQKSVGIKNHVDD